MPKRSVFHDTWKDYFSFSRRERRGIFALLSIILIQIGILIYFKYFPSKEPPQDFSKFEKEVNDFYSSLDTNYADKPGTLFEDQKKYAPASPGKKIELFNFNPNNLAATDWQRLGFSEKQTSVIKNYETKGGKFRTKEDVKKMFCITEKDYSRIEQYIIIPIEKPGSIVEKKKYEHPKVLVDIGIADSIELMNLKGIGPSFARRICIYRDKLGGFVRMEQLHEVWGLSDSLYQTLVSNIYIEDTLNIRKINLNTADFKQLNNHPYIGYQLASLICNYRKQHNGYKTMDELKKIPLVNEELYGKLIPYLKIE
jgi:competence protein ComEA